MRDDGSDRFVYVHQLPFPNGIRGSKPDRRRLTGGGSVKAVQAQLGHRSEQSTHQYAHLGSGAQRELMEALRPARAPHEAVRSGNVTSTDVSVDTHVNLASTGVSNRPLPEAHGNVASTDAGST